MKIFNTQIIKTVSADSAGDFINSFMISDKLVSGWNIRTKETRPSKRRSRYLNMNLHSAGFPKHFNNSSACCSPNNTIINHNNTFSINSAFKYVKLHFNSDFPAGLLRFYKSTSNIFVFNKAHFIRQSGILRITGGGAESRIRNPNDNISFCLRLFRKKSAGPFSGVVNNLSVNKAVRS